MSSVGGSDDSFDAPPRRRSATWLLTLAVAVLAVSALLLVPRGRLWTHIAGYVLSTFVLIGIVAWQRWVTVRLRADRAYAHVPMLDRLGTATVAVGLGVGAAHVWPLATELSR